MEEKRLYISLAITVILIAVFFRRAGYPFTHALVLAFALFIPVINWIVIAHLTSREIPLEREARELRRELGRPLPKDAPGYLREGRRLAGEGRFDEAENVYLEVLKFFPDSRSAGAAKEALQEIDQWRRDNPSASVIL